MVYRLLLIVFIGFCSNYAQGITETYEEVLLKTKFIEVKSVDKIANIIDALKTLTDSKDEYFIANPNGQFNATDVIENNKLPFRRLIFAGKSKEFSFVYYEVGGLAAHLTLVLFQIEQGKLKPVLALTMYEKMKSTKQLKKFIRNSLPIESFNNVLKSAKLRNNKSNKIMIIKHDLDLEEPLFY